MTKKFTNYIPLHVHSTYSIDDAVARIDDLIKRAKEINAPAMAITEHGNMFSFYKFYNAAKNSNIKPIIGCEFYLNDSYYNDYKNFLNVHKKKKTDDDIDNLDKSNYANSHILAYAKNYEGLKNIIHLSNIGFTNFYRKPIISTKALFDTLDTNNIVTTTCLASEFNKLILKREFHKATELLSLYKEKFGEDFYIELHINELPEQELVNKYYQRVAPKLGIKLSLALDSHYVYKEDWEIQYLLYVIKSRNTIKSMPVSSWFYQLHDLYVKSIDEIYDKAEKLGYDDNIINQAIETTFEIADKVSIEIPIYQNNFPKFLNNYTDSEKLFDNKLSIAWDKKLAQGLIPIDQIKAYQERLSYEINIIKDKKFVDYFLILDDLLNNFVYKVGGTTGAGRGSAGGSLILFLLDITKIDPIRYNLIFERFLNPARIDPADVDLDIDHITQKKVENYLKERWGKDRVCHISNFSKFGTKTLIKDICRIYELDYNLSNQLTALFSTVKSDNDIEIELKAAREIAKKMNNKNLINFIDDNWNLFVEKGKKMIGMIRQLGRHASGILISNKILSESDLPIAFLKGDMVTGVQEGGDEREVSELGFLKLDILGLITATVNGNTIKLIEKNYNIKELENQILLSDFDDPDVYKEFEKGNCKDIFQFGSDSMISLIKRIKPNSITDLSAINALFRPALISSGGVEEYCKNRENPIKAKKELDKIHKDLWPLLSETFGIPLFQESIMFILQKIGGFTLAEADKARKILKLLHKGNQDKSEAFLQVIEKFKKQALKNGLSEKNANILLNKLAAYTEYSFNKSHSTAYAMNAYISQWLKVHYPKEYYSVLLNYSTLEDISTYMKQAKMAGIKFGECCYGECTNEFEVDYDKNIIKFGLKSIKGVITSDIYEINEYYAKNGMDLIRFIIQKKINKKTIEILSRLGFFKKIIHPNYYFVEQLIFKLKSSKMQYFEDDYKEYIRFANKFKDYSETEKFKFEKEYLGFYFNEHPFTKFFEKILKQGKPDFFIIPKDLEKEHFGKNVQIMGLVSEINMLKGKKSGREYYKIIIEDDEQQVNITIFDTIAMNNIHIGDIIIIDVNITDFGIIKNEKSNIKIFKNSMQIDNQKKIQSFDEIIKQTVTESWF